MKEIMTKGLPANKPKKMKLVMLRGLPASGKSTWARELVDKEPGKWKRINKDDLRLMVDNGKWSESNEKFILAIRDMIASQSLDRGYSVIIDDTNFAPKHEDFFRKMAKDYGCDFEIKDFTDVDVDECIKRDSKRINSVGVEVIMKMYNQYLKPTTQPQTYNKNLPRAILCDIDGTLAIPPKGANMYDRDFSQDLPNVPVVLVVDDLLMRAEDASVIFVSGRKGKYRQQTIDWLSKVFILDKDYIDKNLFMRPDEDMRKDVIIKKEIYEANFKGKYNILYVLDDRNQTVRGWRELGLTCFQVADGDF